MTSKVNSRNACVFQHWENINIIHDYNQVKEKNNSIISIGTAKALDKIQHPFVFKTPKKNRN